MVIKGIALQRTGSARAELKQKIKCFIAAYLIISTAAISAPEAYAAKGETLVPGGEIVGINVNADGVIVTDLTVVVTDAGEATPAKDAGILPGDVITRIGSHRISCGSDLRSVLDDCSDSVAIQVNRDGKMKQFTVKPCRSRDGVNAIGVLVRDGIAGIGTITFYDPDTGLYGALGHEICDVETQILFPLSSGNIMQAELTETVRAVEGAPGMLHGNFCGDSGLGTVTANTTSGIFGKLKDTSFLGEMTALPTAEADEIHTGEAEILSTVDGDGVCAYTVRITRVSLGAGHGTRNIMFSVTDEDLLEKTGGVVQGMSGSPMIQDGKIIGAVTHVLMNDSKKGYGIFIGNMLDAAKAA